MVGLFGGYGQAAYGRHQYGAASSEIEPRLLSTKPLDGSSGVAASQVLEFIVYYYSSVPDILGVSVETAVRIELSVNGGTSFFTPQAPDYAVTMKALDGQQYWFKIIKATPWPRGVFVVIRYRGTDEHGNVATKTTPIVW